VRKQVAPGSTALVVLVPEAEPLVEPFRKLYDPVAPRGMPPHVTILFPFYAQTDLGPEVVRKLEEHFSGFAPFHFELRETGTFPRVLYLKPEPRSLFSEIISSTADLFPNLLPYGGSTGERIPHVTVAHAETDVELERIRARFEENLASHGPVQGKASRVTLMVRSRTEWLELNSFEFLGDQGGEGGVDL
jgi:2'-5' RNA ligase